MLPQFQEHPQSRISLKLVFGGDCYRLSRFPQNFSELEEISRNKFDNKLPENFCFKYQDSDNDSINVESSSDYEAFLEYCNQERLKAIKLRIDSKSFKQYFNWQDQQYNMAGNQQSYVNQQSQVQQINNIIGMLLNPFSPYYQNMQNKNLKTQFQTASNQDYNLQNGNTNNNYQNSNDQGFSIIQMLMSMMNISSGCNQKLFSTTNSCVNNNGMINGNNNINSNFNNNNNNNTNAVNNSLSSQPLIPPTLSRGASEVTGNDLKKQSVNHSYSNNPETNLSFATERRNIITPLPQQSIQQSIMATFPNVKSSVAKNAIATSNQMNQFLLLQNSLPSYSQNLSDLNITSKFGDASKNDNDKQSNTLHLISGTDIPNPMIEETENDINHKDIKKISSNIGLEEQIPGLTNYLSFVGSQNQFNNSQNLNLAKTSQQLRQPELSSSTISNNIETRSQTTGGGGNLSSNYSANNTNQIQNPQGIRINEALFSSQYTNQAVVSRDQFDVISKEGQPNLQFDKTLENDYLAKNYIKREYSPSPPQSQMNTLANSTNNQSKIRPTQISIQQRSGQNIQVPCEKCMIWHEEQNNEISDKTDKTPSNNVGKDILPYTPYPDCDKCSGTGFLKIEDPNTFGIIQTIVRHKIKEADLILKSLSVRQSKYDKVIPKANMDWLQKILCIQCVQCNDQGCANNINTTSEKADNLFQYSPFTPSQQQKEKEFDFKQINNTNLIQKNIHLLRCSECRNDFSQQKFIYFCIDCKTKDNTNCIGFCNKWPEDIDFDNIICENCESNHDSSHRIVQFCKDDIMTMHSNLNNQPSQNQPSLTNTPVQRTSQLDRSIRIATQTQQATSQIFNYNNINTCSSNMNSNAFFNNTIGMKPKQERNNISSNISTFPQKPIQKTPFSNNLSTQLETSMYYANNMQNFQLQQQQSVTQAALSAQMRQEISQRNSIDAESLLLQQSNLHKMRSKSDNKSVTTFIQNTSQEDQFESFNESQTKDDTNVMPRCSTNQKIVKKVISDHSTLHAPQLNSQQISCITANFNQDDEPPTFSDSSTFKIQKNQIENVIPPSNANIISSPVVSQHPLVSNLLQQNVNVNCYDIIQSDSKNEINLLNDEVKKQKMLEISDNSQGQQPSPDQSQSLQASKLITTNDQIQEDSKLSVHQSASSSGAISNSICVKSPYPQIKSLTTSIYGSSANRTSLTPSGSKQPEDQRQYRAKLVSSYCSNDILIDDSVIAFQEILNNGNENWPENVFLKCISGITDNCQYPVVQVNKGEMMSIAFPIKINQNQATDGDQIKTAWRLYHQQQNEERKFFGPKITIDFQYKKPKKIEFEQTQEFLLVSAIETIRNIFTKDTKSDIEEFVKANQQIAQNYLQDKEEKTISKLIIKYIEQYVTFKNSKNNLDKVLDM